MPIRVNIAVLVFQVDWPCFGEMADWRLFGEPSFPGYPVNIPGRSFAPGQGGMLRTFFIYFIYFAIFGFWSPFSRVCLRIAFYYYCFYA